MDIFRRIDNCIEHVVRLDSKILMVPVQIAG
jgi:hypothetical protein